MPAEKLKHETEERMKKSIDVVKREFAMVRTGRASVGMVDTIKVDYYGVSTPLRQIASITAPEARLILIQPWDKNLIDTVERAILQSDLGITPNNDGKAIRLTVPHLSHERREELAKVIKKKAEDGKVAIRSIRRDANEHVVQLEKKGEITEDERFKTQEEMQKLTDKYIKEIDDILAAKEKELLQM